MKAGRRGGVVGNRGGGGTRGGVPRFLRDLLEEKDVTFIPGILL